MLVPKIFFKYSWIYDEKWRMRMKYNEPKKKYSKGWVKIYGKNPREVPNSRQILNYIKKIDRLWNNYDKKILKELSSLTGLNWKAKIIYCYVVGRCIPFSDPLTIPVYKKAPDYFIDVLIHELIHQLFTQEGNYEKSKNVWDYFLEKYKGKSKTTKIHIPLHAIHTCVYKKFFTEKRLERDIELISSPDYKISWEIVQKEGYQKIVENFRKRIK